ncbi:RluA family pseudouridine synthase [Henriciella barbarensis]|uniref:RluA family pseudouridine synthase n=1 Tax=Henriciella barbarensis TaxID=86342 RepID=A0A399R1V8_9PROT|nr:RluA family pseudouridine synthase [Henriciella barbarensis]RIJ23579.1 RluA family pseudouridine synthase [Henriciella barbarensis]
MSVPPEPEYCPPAPEALALVHADDDLLVANKPAGLLSVPGRGNHKSASVLSYLSERYGPVFDVHRLDLDTSGLIIVARNRFVQSNLAQQFADRKVSKTYEALVRGQMAGVSGAIDLPIGRDWNERPLRRIDHDAGKSSKTLWWLEKQGELNAHLRLRPVTGRTHQLRLHLASIGHPILGDRLYDNVYRSGRLHLHAGRLDFTHPATGKPVQFLSAKPFDLRGVKDNTRL